MNVDKAIFTIGVASNLLDLHPRTLRLYEEAGLVKPKRKGAWRYYSGHDLKWIRCLRSMIHEKGINTAAIRKLLQYTPCWNIAECPLEKRKTCVTHLNIER